MSALVGAEAWFLYNLQAEKDMAMTQKKHCKTQTVLENSLNMHN